MSTLSKPVEITIVTKDKVDIMVMVVVVVNSWHFWTFQTIYRS